MQRLDTFDPIVRLEPLIQIPEEILLSSNSMSTNASLCYKLITYLTTGKMDPNLTKDSCGNSRYAILDGRLLEKLFFFYMSDHEFTGDVLYCKMRSSSVFPHVV